MDSGRRCESNRPVLPKDAETRLRPQSQHPGKLPNSPANRASREDAGAPEATLADQRQRVAELEARESLIRNLRDRQCRLEVEHIAVEAALRATRSGVQRPIASGTARAIVHSLDRRQELERVLSVCNRRLAQRADADSEELQRLQGGRDALIAWLEAPRLRALERTRHTLKIVLPAAILVSITAAVTVHPAFLLLLVPIGPLSLLLRTGQDTEWRRLGAQRRFKETGLEAPDAWNERSVRARIAVLDAAINGVLQQVGDLAGPPETVQQEQQAVSAKLTEENECLRRLLAEGGLQPETLDKELEQWLWLIARADQSRRDLVRLKADLKAASADAEQIREQLFRYLARQGEAPANGRADTAALAAGLERLAVRPRTSDRP